MADKWEKGVPVQNSELALSACPVEEVSDHSITHITHMLVEFIRAWSGDKTTAFCDCSLI